MKEGYLTKEGGAVRSWKKRWFCLNGPELSYYKQKGGQLMGQIPLDKAEKIALVDDYRKKKFCFEVVTPGRTYHIVAANQAECDSWIAALNESRKLAPNPAPAPAAAAGAAPAASSLPSNSSSGALNAEEKRVSVEDFEIRKVIGKGSFGKVLLVAKKSGPDAGQVYAMKVLNKQAIIERNELEHTKAEKSILMKLDNPFLVKLHYAFQTPEKLYFVMDFVNGGELFFHLQKSRKFDEKRVKFYAAEIVLGLSYLHNEGVIYRDLKPENLLLTADGHICMTDFGISKEGLQAKDDRTATFCGTPEYLAPEVLKGKGYGKAVDWWSFGTLMYEMLTGLPPFYCEEVQMMYSKIMNGKLTLSDDMSADTKDILNGLLERDPEKRLADPEQIQKHPYFADIDWKALYNKALPVPYTPPVTNASDVSMIDAAFLDEMPESHSESSEISAADQGNFEGFTFVQGSAINK